VWILKPGPAHCYNATCQSLSGRGPLVPALASRTLTTRQRSVSSPTAAAPIPNRCAPFLTVVPRSDRLPLQSSIDSAMCSRVDLILVKARASEDIFSRSLPTSHELLALLCDDSPLLFALHRPPLVSHCVKHPMSCRRAVLSSCLKAWLWRTTRSCPLPCVAGHPPLHGCLTADALPLTSNRSDDTSPRTAWAPTSSLTSQNTPSTAPSPYRHWAPPTDVRRRGPPIPVSFPRSISSKWYPYITGFPLGPLPHHPKFHQWATRPRVAKPIQLGLANVA
jgi:hypothetical protein